MLFVGRLLASDHLQDLARTLDFHLLAHAFAAVSRQSVRNLVRHDDRDPRFVLADRQDALIERDLATGQAERVLRFVVDDRELPLVVSAAAGGSQSLANTFHDLFVLGVG